jgi:S-adenosylmethionine decarboxylase proenzyme
MTEYKSPPVGQEISCVMQGIKKDILLENNLLIELIKKILKKENFEILDFSSHDFEPHGFTALVLLSESHLAIHTYPEYSSLYFNMYSCRGPKDSENTFNELKKKLNPEKILFMKIDEVRVEKVY